jgi:hypothetical protein
MFFSDNQDDISSKGSEIYCSRGVFGNHNTAFHEWISIYNFQMHCHFSSQGTIFNCSHQILQSLHILLSGQFSFLPGFGRFPCQCQNVHVPVLNVEGGDFMMTFMPSVIQQAFIKCNCWTGELVDIQQVHFQNGRGIILFKPSLMSECWNSAVINNFSKEQMKSQLDINFLTWGPMCRRGNQASCPLGNALLGRVLAFQPRWIKKYILKYFENLQRNCENGTKNYHVLFAQFLKY